MERWWEVFWVETELSASPAIRIGFLLKQGLLQPGVPAEFRWQWTSNRDWEMKAIWDPGADRLSIVNRRTDQVVYETGIARVSNGRQRHVLFFDPKTGIRFKIIYFYKGAFATREGLGIKYPSQRITAADRREVAIQNQEWLTRPWPTPPDPEVIKSRAQPRTIVEAETLRNGTAHALSRGKPISEENFYQLSVRIAQFLPFNLPELPSPPPRPWPVDELETGIWELQPRLEMSELQAAGLFKNGEWTMAELHYDHDRARLTEAIVSINQRNPVSPRLILFNYYRSRNGKVRDVYLSHIELTTPDDNPQHRRYLICPFTGRSVESLAYRGGAWGSKEALGLEYASQRSKRYFDRIMRANVDAPKDKQPAPPQPRLRHQRR